jgi:hypothetical protein
VKKVLRAKRPFSVGIGVISLSEPYVLAEDAPVISSSNQGLRDKGKEEQKIHLEAFPDPLLKS